MSGHATTRTLLIALVLATAALAGCASTRTEDGGGPTTFQEAMDAPGPVLEPTNADSPIRLKLVAPSDPNAVATGELPVTVLVYDSEAAAPVTNADFGTDQDGCAPDHGFCAEMPEMGHGTSPEQAPAHQGDGLYEGLTTISMPGSWVLHLNPSVDGQVLEFDAQLQASE